MTHHFWVVTDATKLRNRFRNRTAIYRLRISEACEAYKKNPMPHLWHVHEVNRQSLIAVIACYGDATNMSFAQARTALDVNQTMLDKLP